MCRTVGLFDVPHRSDRRLSSSSSTLRSSHVNALHHHPIHCRSNKLKKRNSCYDVKVEISKPHVEAGGSSSDEIPSVSNIKYDSVKTEVLTEKDKESPKMIIKDKNFRESLGAKFRITRNRLTSTAEDNVNINVNPNNINEILINDSVKSTTGNTAELKDTLNTDKRFSSRLVKQNAIRKAVNHVRFKDITDESSSSSSKSFSKYDKTVKDNINYERKLLCLQRIGGSEDSTESYSEKNDTEFDFDKNKPDENKMYDSKLTECSDLQNQSINMRLFNSKLNVLPVETAGNKNKYHKYDLEFFKYVKNIKSFNDIHKISTSLNNKNIKGSREDIQLLKKDRLNAISLPNIVDDQDKCSLESTESYPKLNPSNRNYRCNIDLTKFNRKKSDRRNSKKIEKRLYANKNIVRELISEKLNDGENSLLTTNIIGIQDENLRSSVRNDKERKELSISPSKSLISNKMPRKIVRSKSKNMKSVNSPIFFNHGKFTQTTEFRSKF